STTATLKDFVLGDFGDCSAHLSTQVSSSSVTRGTSVHDTLTVSGNRPNLTPSGTVSWFLCSFSAASTSACDDSDAAHHGTSLASSSLGGSGGTATADSPNVNAGTPLSPGRYCFRAEWPGDSNYQPVSPATKFVEFGGANGTNECFLVVQSPSTVTTTPKVSGATIANPVAVNTVVTDYVRVDGATGFGDPTGTVSFFICNPSQISGPAGSEVCATGAGSAVTGNP